MPRVRRRDDAVRERERHQAKAWRDANPERHRSNALYSRFRITAEQYDALLEAQDGVCAICGEVCASGVRLSVDHDRSCCPGKRSCGRCVRGLLCAHCNHGIGKFRDDLELLRRAGDYLATHQGSQV